ncbi:MAG: ATP-dependent helicase [Chloroflexota bacterium]
MRDLLVDLNVQQQQAVTAGLGPILVMAGPGSGKTRVLTRRMAYLIGAMGVRPYNILAVTFTNKAAREMESRVSELMGESTRGMWLGTFHAICARLLHMESANLPLQPNFVIFDQDDQLELVKQVLREENLDEKRYRPQAVHASISSAKNELILPDAYPVQTYRDEVVRKVYKRYQELLVNSNAADFDDLLVYAAFLLENNLEVRTRWAQRFEHILVDEFQDTNQAQYKLLTHLASFHHNLFVVGDADQSIYRWRGADYRNVLRFQEDYANDRNMQTILLEQNYRSTQSILDVAMAVIDRNPRRTRKQLFSDRGEGHKVGLYEAYDDRQEASFVVESIAKLVKLEKRQPSEFAVMYRTNAQSRLLEEAFLAAGLPYRLVGAQRFYGRREIKDIVSFLRLVHNPSDEVGLSRVINIPPRGVGAKTLAALRMLAQSNQLSAGQYLLQMARDPNLASAEALGARVRGPLVNFGALLGGWIAQKDSLPPLGLMDRVIEDIDYQSYINDGTEEGRDRWENVMELRRLAADYQNEGLQAFLERVALVSDQDTLEGGANAPTLLTLHAAKGLEFPVVFLVGLNDGTLPHTRSFDDPEAMLEERRLLYVGITRAGDRLYLTYPQNRSSYGYAEGSIPSRYLDDIPSGLLDEVQSVNVRSSRERSPSSGRAGGGSSERYERWELPSPARQAGKPVEPRFKPGMRVIHPDWGEGMVLNVRIDGSDEILDIHFGSVGLKRVMASLARLEIKS